MSTHHLLIAHGSPDPRHRAMMRTLAGLVDDRGLPCSVAYLEHDLPTVEAALKSLGTGRVVALGMLLAPGYHATVDVPHLLSLAPDDLMVEDRGPFGTGPWLVPSLEWLVADIGAVPDTPVIIATAGSTRAEARVAVAQFASEWGRTRAGDVVVAAATGPGLSLEDAAARLSQVNVAPGVRVPQAVVLPLMIAPGVLADRAAKVAARHGLLTTGCLAEAPPFVDALVARLTGRLTD